MWTCDFHRIDTIVVTLANVQKKINEKFAQMSIIICSICSDNLDTVKSTVTIECGHTYHETCVKQWKEISKACPDCRAKICNEKKIFLSGSDFSDTAVEPISDAALMATLDAMSKKISQYENEIAQFEENQLNFQTALSQWQYKYDEKKKKIKTLENTASDRNRKLAGLKKEVTELEKNVKTVEEKSKKLSATIADKEQQIHRMNSTIQSMEAKNDDKIQKIVEEKCKKLSATIADKEQQIHRMNSTIQSMKAKNDNKIQENADLNSKMLRMNECIDKLRIRKSIDKLMNQRVSQSQSAQKIQNKSSAKPKQ